MSNYLSSSERKWCQSQPFNTHERDSQAGRHCQYQQANLTEEGRHVCDQGVSGSFHEGLLRARRHPDCDIFNQALLVARVENKL